MSKKITQTSVDKPTAQRILRSVPYNKGFHFFTDVGKYTGETAIDLFAFYEEVRVIEKESFSFHFSRHDFQFWVKDTLGDEQLAEQIDKIEADQPLDDVRKKLLGIVESRLTELHSIAKDP